MANMILLEKLSSNSLNILKYKLVQMKKLNTYYHHFLDFFILCFFSCDCKRILKTSSRTCENNTLRMRCYNILTFFLSFDFLFSLFCSLTIFLCAFLSSFSAFFNVKPSLLPSSPSPGVSPSPRPSLSMFRYEEDEVDERFRLVIDWLDNFLI